ncbi:DUF3054 domain-containing protein [Nocardioides gilvus]|uniref:DUF3054 domain-containing protein n=1 Tax=Nocardioides gilvus TaxID=1735589 RepID=UPI000D74BCD8|nr:DUF3054 domain-containing protein [Nocardioides gilvus]
MSTSTSPYVLRLGALALDAVLVVVFAVLGARTHHDGALGVEDVADVAWPFLVGLGLAHALLQTPFTLRSGLLVWLSTVVVGMVLRQLTGDGTAVAFVVVATLFNFATLLGWRAIATWRARRT